MAGRTSSRWACFLLGGYIRQMIATTGKFADVRLDLRREESGRKPTFLTVSISGPRFPLTYLPDIGTKHNQPRQI